MEHTGMNKGQKILVRAEDVAKVGDSYYFVALELNAICEIDPEHGNVKVVGTIPGESLFEERLCSKIYSLGNELIFLPMNGEKVWIYETNQKQWRSLELENSALTDMKMMQAVKYENRIYFIGCFYPAIAVWDMDTDKVTYIREPYEEMKDLQARERINYFRCDYVLKEGVLYLASCLTNAVLKLNLINYQWEFLQVGKSGNRYAGITWDGEYFWLAPRLGNTLVRWDGNNAVTEYIIQDEILEGFFRFTGAVYKDGIVLCPAKDGRISYEIRNHSILKQKDTDRQYLFYKVTDEGEIISGTPDGIIQIETASGKEFWIKCEIDITEVKRKFLNTQELKKYFEERDNMIEENQIVSLSDLCKYVELDIGLDATNAKDPVMVGDAIRSELKKHVKMRC